MNRFLYPFSLNQKHWLAWMSVCLLILCWLRPATESESCTTKTTGNDWQALRSLAPATLTVTLATEPAPHLEGANAEGEVIWQGFLSSVSAPHLQGWAGPISLGIITDQDRAIQSVHILHHQETPSFFRGLEEPWFLRQFVGKTPTSRFVPGEDIDGLSQATVSVEAFCRTIQATLRHESSQDPSAPPKSTFVPADKTAFRLTISVIGAICSAMFLAPRFPRLHALIGFILLGVITPQFVSLAHIDAVRRALLSLTAPVLPAFILLSAATVLCLVVPRGYCRLLCPAGHLQDLLSLAVSRSPTETRESTPNHGDAELEIKPFPFGRLLLWSGMGAFILTPTFPLHHLEVFSALLFRNMGIGGWLLVFAFLIGSLSTRRWYCLTLCPLHHLFADLESLRQSGRRPSPEASPRQNNALSSPVEHPKS